MSEGFFTKEQKNIIRNDFRVGAGYVIVKIDEGVAVYAPIYVNRESGNLYNPHTGKLMEFFLGDDATERISVPVDCHELHSKWMKLYNFCPECGADVRLAEKDTKIDYCVCPSPLHNSREILPCGFCGKPIRRYEKR